MKLVIATKNRNKIFEIQDKFSGIPGLELIPLTEFAAPPDVIEDGATFEENALKKARAVAGHTGCAAMADDSGLVVDALDGRPGIYSARYGGDGASDAERCRRILDEMADIPDGKRTARFECAIAIVLKDGTAHCAKGACEGTITRRMKGGHGFGYDPIFYLPERGMTMAEIPLDEKNRISHRGRALDAAREVLMRAMAAGQEG